jgi:short-subunit dehydrogenase
MESWNKQRSMEPDGLARKALDAVEKNQPLIVIPRWYKAVWWLDRAAPRITLRLFEAVLNRDLDAIAPAKDPDFHALG